MTALLADDATAAILITTLTGAAIILIAALIDHITTRRHTMSTKARKQRKAAGIPFTKPVKTPTPFHERSDIAGLVPGPVGTRHEGKLRPRSEKNLRPKFEARGLEHPGGAA